jgi:hypothetical protein
MAEEIGAIGAERHPTLLADFVHTGAQAAGDTYTFTAAKLEKDEVAEIEYMELFAPNAAGMSDFDKLKQVIPIIDDFSLESYVSLTGQYDNNMIPPRLNQIAGPSAMQMTRQVFRFGEPGVANPLLNVTLKAKKSINAKTIAGDTAVANDYRIRFYGYKYREESELKEVFGDSVYGAEASLVDYNRGKRLGITKERVEVTFNNWDMLVGGVKQRKPQIMPLVRYAYNKLATTANTAYDFEYLAGKVASAEENMYWDLSETEAVFIKGMGVRSPTNLKLMGIKIGDREYPRGVGVQLFRVDEQNNPLHFGHGYPLFPANLPFYVSIPVLPLGYLIHAEKGRIIVYDNGASIAANNILVAVQGISVEL